MLRLAHLTVSVAGVALRLTLRSRSFAVLSLLAVLAVVAGTLPVSPGLAAGEARYLKAGASTLLLGGLGCFFVVGGGAYLAVAELSCAGADPGALALAVAHGFFLALITAALVTALATILAPPPALAAAVMFILAGQATALWPATVAAFLPPFDILDPGVYAASNPVGGSAGVLLRGAASFGLYVCLAAGVQRMRRALG